MTRPGSLAPLLLPFCLAMAACAAADTAHTDDPANRAAVRAQEPASVQMAAVATALPPMTVRKHPACGCCSVWIEHMRRAGFSVTEENIEDMAPTKVAAGVPTTMGSCHTAHVGGYFIEGHVPAEDVLRLLRERPDAKGLAVSGMPMGSPGMEHPDGVVQPYTVHLVLSDGSTREFSRHGGD